MSGCAGMLQLAHRPYLDASQAQRRGLRGQLDGLVEVFRLDQDEAAELLLGLREGPIGRRYAAVPQPERRGGLHGFEGVGGDEVTVLFEDVVVVERLADERVELALRERVQVLLVIVDQAQVLHGATPPLRSRQLVVGDGPESTSGPMKKARQPRSSASRPSRKRRSGSCRVRDSARS